MEGQSSSQRKIINQCNSFLCIKCYVIKENSISLHCAEGTPLFIRTRNTDITYSSTNATSYNHIGVSSFRTVKIILHDFSFSFFCYANDDLIKDKHFVFVTVLCFFVFHHL